jgi:hypothetical protein
MSNPFKVVGKSAPQAASIQLDVPANEARRSPRRAYDRPIGILLHGTYKVYRALQLGEGGLAFATDKKMDVKPNAEGEIKDHLVVSIILPGVLEAIVTRAEITYQNVSGRDFHYGVQFLEMPLHVRRIIRNYVTAKTQEEAEQEILARDAGKTGIGNH